MKAYEEIMRALSFYWTDDDEEMTEEAIREIIAQEHDPIQSISNALDKYRSSIPVYDVPPPADNWIKCSERMPEERELIIFSIKKYGVMHGFEVHVGRYEESPSWFLDEDESVYPPHIVTHWQPLPAPPRIE
jgi:Protein of unknown function (DUF551)